MAVAPGGLLGPRTAAAELRGGEAAAAILWRGLRLRKRWLHPVVSAAAASPAPIRRRGLGLRSSRHGAGVSSSGKLPPTRSTGVREKRTAGLARRRILPCPPPGAALARTDASRTSRRPQRTVRPGPRAAPHPGGFPHRPRPPTCTRRAREGAEPWRARSANGNAAPAFANAERPAGGGALRRRARQKGRAPRPERTSTPSPRAVGLGRAALCGFLSPGAVRTTLEEANPAGSSRHLAWPLSGMAAFSPPEFCGPKGVDNWLLPVL